MQGQGLGQGSLRQQGGEAGTGGCVSLSADPQVIASHGGLCRVALGASFSPCFPAGAVPPGWVLCWCSGIAFAAEGSSAIFSGPTFLSESFVYDSCGAFRCRPPNPHLTVDCDGSCGCAPASIPSVHLQLPFRWLAHLSLENKSHIF